jgi:hypothetical protein
MNLGGLGKIPEEGVEVLTKYMSIVESMGVGQSNTGMCDMMKQDKSIEYCS